MHRHHQIVEKLGLKGKYLILCTQYLFLVFLQFLRDVALCLCQRLLAHPLLGHLILIGITNFEVVAEHIVVTDFQRRNTSLFCLSLLNLQQIVLTAIGNITQLVKFSIHTSFDDTTFSNKLWRIILYLLLYTVFQRLTEIQLFPYPIQGLILSIKTRCLDGLDGLQSRL